MSEWFARRDAIVTRGRCESCDRYGFLHDFTALRCVQIGVPIFPLGRRRVLRHCIQCQGAYEQLPIGEWKRRLASDLAPALAALEEAPRDADVALEAIEAAVALGARQAFHEVALRIEKDGTAGATLLLALARAYDHFLMGKAAATAARRALGAGLDDTDDRIAAASILVRAGAIEEVRPEVDELIATARPEALRPLGSLWVDALQADGAHDEALDALDLLDAVDDEPPGVIARARARARRSSEKNRSSGRSDLAAGLRVARNDRPTGLPRNLAPLFVLPVLVALAAAIPFAIGLSPRTVHLVGGLDRAYRVSINGEAFEVPRNGRIELWLHDREIEVALLDTDLGLRSADGRREPPIPPARYDLGNRFSALGDTVVLNPDATALLDVEEVYYAVNVNMAPDPRYTLRAPGAFHLLDVDIAFDDFPAEVDLSSRSTVASRTRVVLERPPTASAIGLVRGRLDERALRRWIERRLLLEPDRDASQLIDSLVYLVEPDELIAFLKRGLAHRPVLVPWHRTYQDLVGGAGRAAEIETEYAALREATPDDRSIAWLLSRMRSDVDERERLLDEACQDPSPCPDALYEAAYWKHAEGTLEEALVLARKAETAEPGRVAFTALVDVLLQATGAFDELQGRLERRATRAWSQDVWTPYALALDRAEALAQGGRVGEARRLLDQSFTAIRPHLASTDIQQTRAEADLVLAEATEDAAAIDDALARNTDGYAAFRRQVSAGQLGVASGLLEALVADGLPDADDDHLILFILATSKGENELAAMHLRLAIDALAISYNGGKNALASILATDEPPTLDAVTGLALPIAFRALYLAAVATRFPTVAADCLALARRLDADPSHPHHLLRPIVHGE